MPIIHPGDRKDALLTTVESLQQEVAVKASCAVAWSVAQALTQ